MLNFFKSQGTPCGHMTKFAWIWISGIRIWRGDILHNLIELGGLASESYGKKRSDKIKAKAKTCSMHLKRHLMKGDLGRLWNTYWLDILKRCRNKKGEESSFAEQTVEGEWIDLLAFPAATFHCLSILGTCHWRQLQNHQLHFISTASLLSNLVMGRKNTSWLLQRDQ